MNARNLTPAEQVVELQDEFMIESAEYKLSDENRRTELIHYINAILDAYLDLWPELYDEQSL